MDRMRGRLFERFGELGIEAPTVPYPAHGSVEEGKALRGQLSGTFTKNLLIKDKKGRMYLMVVREDRALDLRTLHKQIGASGRLGFAGSDQMRSVLGIEPGALTPFATLNDTAGVVTLVIESALLGADRLNFTRLSKRRARVFVRKTSWPLSDHAIDSQSSSTLMSRNQARSRRAVVRLLETRVEKWTVPAPRPLKIV